MTSARVGTYRGRSSSLLLTDGSDLYASSVSFFSDFFLVVAISDCSALSCFCNSSVCRSSRSIFSESDNGSATAGLKARQQVPTRALPINLCVARKVTSN